MRPVVMFDVDGVLTDWVLGFTTLAAGMFGTPVVRTVEQPTWDFHTSGLLTRAQEEATWAAMKVAPRWWESLEPLVAPQVFWRIVELKRTSEVLFVTNRASDAEPPGQQTSRWLSAHWIDKPSVVVSGKKGEVAKAVGATHSLEDKAENAWMIHWLTEGRAASFLLDRPYNRIHQSLPEIGTGKVIRLGKVEEFLAEVER